jgi:hypothetical protein
MMDNAPVLGKEGFCQCGCGEVVPIAQRNENRRGWIKGKPIRFLPGHNAPKGHFSKFWKREKLPFSHSDGYIWVYAPDHPKANNRYVLEHILVCERTLGKNLPPKAEPHHMDSDRKNNDPSNLVVCQDRGYHMFLERRTRALKACGHADWRKCKYCHEYDAPTNLYINGSTVYHRVCRNGKK